MREREEVRDLQRGRKREIREKRGEEDEDRDVLQQRSTLLLHGEGISRSRSGATGADERRARARIRSGTRSRGADRVLERGVVGVVVVVVGEEGEGKQTVEAGSRWKERREEEEEDRERDRGGATSGRGRPGSDGDGGRATATERRQRSGERRATSGR
jgi:hypothetical protein